MRAVLVAEMQEREHATAEMRRVNRPDRADALHAETLLIGRYITRTAEAGLSES